MIVAVQDGDFILKYKPDVKVMYYTEEWVKMIRTLKVVDEVVVYQKICPEFLEKINFNVLALGEDYTSERFMVTSD